MRYLLLLTPEEDMMSGPDVVVGRADLDPTTWHGPANALIVPSLPEMLRTFADQIESAMTTGPPEGWLEPEEQKTRNGRSP